MARKEKTYYFRNPSGIVISAGKVEADRLLASGFKQIVGKSAKDKELIKKAQENSQSAAAGTNLVEIQGTAELVEAED